MTNLIRLIYNIADSIRFWFLTLYALIKTGVIKPVGPKTLFKIVRVCYRNGPSLSLLCSLAAIRSPDRIAVIDDNGALTFSQLSTNSNNIACALYEKFNLNKASNIAILCRNHRDFIQATLASSRLGASLLFINVDFSGAQIEHLLDENRVDLLICDEEFIALIKEIKCDTATLIANADRNNHAVTLSDLSDQKSTIKLPTARQGKMIVLTSGSTGTAKGAMRTPTLRAVISPFTTLLTQLPLKNGMPSLISIPLFHGFGLAAMATALALNAPIVLSRRFDAAKSLMLLEKHKAGIWVVVPVMLNRLLTVLPENFELTHLQAVISGGAPIREELVLRTLQRLGKKLFNLYGTSEAGFATIATPNDLAKYPTTAGHASEGVTLAILGRHNEQLDAGKIGRICVSGRMVFSQYSGGQLDKKIADNFIDTGDLGYLNAGNFLFLCGRSDNMIVSGGENVFPVEIENILARHPAVEDVAVIPMDDNEFGQRLHAFIVIKSSERLTAVDFKDYLRPQIARYKMPATINLVEHLPRNALGKVNQRLLQPVTTTN